MSELAAGFEIVAPDQPRVPVVAHIPHASTTLPDEVRGEIVLSEGELNTLDGVRAARYEGAEIILSVVHTQAVIAALFALLERRGLELEDLRTHRPTLEDVFVSLTGKHLRDA